MNAEDCRKRTKRFAIRVIQFVEGLPNSGAAYVIGGQLVRAGTSVGANYRSACRARSRADFIAKMKIVEEECDESLYWLELFDETGHKSRLPVEDLMKEADELLAMVVASIKTARSPT
jgi:four helix bundle protein